MKCIHCGAELPDGAKFCPNCTAPAAPPRSRVSDDDVEAILREYRARHGKADPSAAQEPVKRRSRFADERPAEAPRRSRYETLSFDDRTPPREGLYTVDKTAGLPSAPPVPQRTDPVRPVPLTRALDEDDDDGATQPLYDDENATRPLYDDGAGHDEPYLFAPEADTGVRRAKKSHKALWISAVALLVVIALLSGVIFIVTRVGASEIQQAKDSYEPPAKSIAIDKTLSDPSNDRIRFTYDNRARIVSCTYTINSRQYDQQYTYNDDERWLKIDTSYKKRPIHSMEIGYNLITLPNTFEEIDGYYVRLDEKCLNTPSVPAATQPPAPTDAPAPTKAPASADFKELYLQYLEQADQEYSGGKLIYLNGDDVPELILDITPVGAQTFTSRICYIDNGEVKTADVSARSQLYQERSGILKSVYSLQTSGGFTVYSFDGRELTEEKRGSWMMATDGSLTRIYRIGDDEVSEDEYNAALGETEGWLSLRDDRVESDALPDYIRSFS